MKAASDSVVNKLIVLFFMDKMDVPMTESIIMEACYYKNTWLEYMDCVQSLNLLIEAGFIYKTVRDNTTYYSITSEHAFRSFIRESRLPSVRR